MTVVIALPARGQLVAQLRNDPKFKGLNPVFSVTSDMYHKNITNVNDASSVINEWRHNLAWHLLSSITLLESSIMLPENIYSTDVTSGNHHMTITRCLWYRQQMKGGIKKVFRELVPLIPTWKMANFWLNTNQIYKTTGHGWSEAIKHFSRVRVDE